MVIWKYYYLPRCKALGIAVVATLSLVCVVNQGTVEIHLLAWIILMHIEAIARDVVGGVLNRVKTAGFWVLGNSDRIAKTPSKWTPGSAWAFNGKGPLAPNSCQSQYQRGVVKFEAYIPETNSICIKLIAIRWGFSNIESFDLAVPSANVRS